VRSNDRVHEIGASSPRIARIGTLARKVVSVKAFQVDLSKYQRTAQARASCLGSPHGRTALEAGGPHDFDFEIGTWKTHIYRLLHPLAGSTTWADYDGTSVVRKVWQGRANSVELEVAGPAGHIEGLGLRLYNPISRQWSLNFANSAVGTLGVPTVGEFKNGRGEFYDQEMIGVRMVLVRNVWFDMTVNWIAIDTRIQDIAQVAHPFLPKVAL